MAPLASLGRSFLVCGARQILHTDYLADCHSRPPVSRLNSFPFREPAAVSRAGVALAGGKTIGGRRLVFIAIVTFVHTQNIEDSHSLSPPAGRPRGEALYGRQAVRLR